MLYGNRHSFLQCSRFRSNNLYYSNTCTIVIVLFKRCRCLFTVITATQGLHTGATNIYTSHFKNDSQKSVTVHNALATRTSILHDMAADSAYDCYNIQTPHNKFPQIRQRLPSGLSTNILESNITIVPTYHF